MSVCIVLSFNCGAILYFAPTQPVDIKASFRPPSHSLPPSLPPSLEPFHFLPSLNP